MRKESEDKPSHPRTQSDIAKQLGAIADKFGIPREWLVISDQGRVRIIAHDNLPYAEAILIIGELQVRHLPLDYDIPFLPSLDPPANDR